MPYIVWQVSELSTEVTPTPWGHLDAEKERKLNTFCLPVKLMDWDEHIMLISHTVNLFSDHILVIGNTGSNSTKEALHATEQGFAVGMHASLQINPYYGKTSMPGATQ